MSLLHQPFEAQALHPDQGNEVVAGNVVLTPHELRFESGLGVWAIPIQRLVAEVRQGDEERIVFTDTALPGLQIFTVDLELLNCREAPAVVRAREALVERLSRREWKRRIKLVAYCAASCIAIIWLGGKLMGFMVYSVAGRIPPEWDAEFGANVVASLGEEGTFLDDTNAVARLTALAEPLLRVLPPAPNGYQFHILDDEDVNACALPGGHIVVNTGLLKLADRPEQVAGVIAHEVAHVTERHLYRSQISTAGPLLLCGVFMGGQGGVLSLISGGTVLVAGAGFSQEYETEADDLGWDYLVAANIDPRGLAEMFQKMEAGLVGELDLMPQALSTHPALEKRIRRLEAKWRKLPAKGDFITLDSRPVLSP